MNTEEFQTLSLSKEMLLNLNKIGYSSMTAVQEQSLPHILDNKDIIAQAKTGSGKTAAFGIGVLSKLNVKNFKPQTLILCPTRELAEQVSQELRTIAKFTQNIKILTLCGGVAFGPQLGSLRHGAHIVIGTPGRVLKHLNKNSLQLNNITSFVLDEADRMLDMGFIEDIQEIRSHLPSAHQTLLFSATFDDEILTLSKSIQNNAIHIKTLEMQTKNKVLQEFYKTTNKRQTILDIFCTYQPKNCIVFCNTKVEVDQLTQNLQKNNIDALSLHGDMEQYDRNDVLVQFTNASCCVLVATDVAARGLDIKELAMVINYDLPHSYETYTHRIGRTARAGAEGIACNLFEDEIEEFLDEESTIKETSSLKHDENFKMVPQNITLVIEGGKKDKLRAGDILGTLTATKTLHGSNIGKIDIYDRQSYVAISYDFIDEAKKILSKNTIKKKRFSVWIL